MVNSFDTDAGRKLVAECAELAFTTYEKHTPTMGTPWNALDDTVILTWLIAMETALAHAESRQGGADALVRLTGAERLALCEALMHMAMSIDGDWGSPYPWGAMPVPLHILWHALGGEWQSYTYAGDGKATVCP